MWYHNTDVVENTDKYIIDTTESSSSLTILSCTHTDEGYYTCKATNEIGMNLTRAKLILTTMAEQEIIETPEVKKKVKRRTRKIVKKTIQVQEYASSSDDEATLTIVKPQVYCSEDDENEDEKRSEDQIIHETTSESAVTTEIEVINFVETSVLLEEIETIKYATEVNEILNRIHAIQFGPGERPLRELATIGFLVQKGITINEITELYNTNKFPSLKLPESQSALVQLVEREGHAKIISDVLTEETDEEESFVAATVGFRAFIRMIEMKHTTVEEVITRFQREDFIQQEWKMVTRTEV